MAFHMEHWYLYTRLHGMISHNTVILTSLSKQQQTLTYFKEEITCNIQMNMMEA